VNSIIQVYSRFVTLRSFVEPFLTTYSTKSTDFGNYEIHPTKLTIDVRKTNTISISHSPPFIQGINLL